jgi:hypothetical protein
MRFLKPLLDLTRRDKQRNIDVRSKLNQDNIADEIRNYQQYWLQHVNRLGKNPLTEYNTTVSAPRKRRYMPHKKKMERTGLSESD